MGPSLARMMGIIKSSPTMWHLTMNPAFLRYLDFPGLFIMAMGSCLAIINTRIIITCALIALMFFRYREIEVWQNKLVLVCAFVWFCTQVWMMYQGFILGWIA